VNTRRAFVLVVAGILYMTPPASAAQRAAGFHLEEATIGQIQQAIRSHQITTFALVEQYLQRIRAYNGTCVNEPDGILGVISTIPHARQINALSTLNLRPATRAKWGFDRRKARSLTDPKDDSPDMPDALEVAAAQDRAFARTGRLAGPLHGAVMAIKDQYDTFDMRTTSGGDADYANDRPPADATFVKRLRLNAGGIGPSGEGKFEINRYLRERGDANIRSNADLIAKSRFYTDPNFPDRKQARERDEAATVLDTSVRLQGRFAMQTMLLQCMQDQRLDALVSPMSTVPPRKLTSPREPAINGRTPIGWSLIGQQGFPAITVPAGFTTTVWDRVADGNDGARLVGPVPASLPVGVDFIALPFGEPLLFRIASAYEAATRHRRPPPDFGPVEAPAMKLPKVTQ